MTEKYVLIGLAIFCFFLQPKHIYKSTLRTWIHNGTTEDEWGQLHSNRWPNHVLKEIPHSRMMPWQLITIGVLLGIFMMATLGEY